jgi:hypothetical protein
MITMVHSSQNHAVSGLCERSGIVRTRKHNVPETQPVSVCRCGRGPLWSSGQSSWLQIRRPGFDCRHYQIFPKKRKKRKKTVVGLERGSLSLVSTTEELLDRKVAAPV